MKLELVTPETTLLDADVASLQVPLFDGSAGILPGHAATVGRLGSGKLSVKLTTADDNGRTDLAYFVDGGFLQIKGETVTVLTQRALPLAKIDAEAARKELAAARAMTAHGDEAIESRQAAQERARRMLALAR